MPSPKSRRPILAAARSIASLIAFSSFALISCGGGGSASRPETAVGAALDAATLARREAWRECLRRAAPLGAALDDEALAGAVMMVGVDGAEFLSRESESALRAIKPGAVILFGYNVQGTPATAARLCGAIRGAAASGGLPPLIAIDHEGGPVFRFRRGLTRLPSASVMGAAGEAAAAAAGRAAGTELRAMGITLNLAPVFEAENGANTAFLAGRAWSDDPMKAARLAGIFAEACQTAGAAAAIKHFPGSASDPHKGAATIDASIEELRVSYLEPFAEAARSGATAVMLSHATVRALDADRPATFSPAVIAALRNGLGFEGAVITDDLAMAAVSGSGSDKGARVAQAAVAALQSGADVVMISGGPAVGNARKAILAALGDGRLPRVRLEEAASRLIAVKLSLGLDYETDAERASRLSGLATIVEADTAALEAALAYRASR